METVRTKINIDSYRSRYPGLLPYVEYAGDGTIKVVSDVSKGNIGGFPVSIASNTTYMDNVSDFHKLSGTLSSCRYFKRVSGDYFSEIDNGRFLAEARQLSQAIYSFRDYIRLFGDEVVDIDGVIESGNGLFAISGVNGSLVVSLSSKDSLLGYELRDYSGDYRGIEAFERLEKDYLGRIFVPDYYRSGTRCPVFVYWCEIAELLEKMRSLKDGRSCCTLGTYKDYGGDLFYEYLQRIKQNGINPLPVTDDAKPMTFNLPLSLVNTIGDIGLFNVIEDDRMESGTSRHWYDKDDINVPSVFERFLHIDGYQYDDSGSELCGTYPVVVENKLVCYPGCFEFKNGVWSVIRRPINVKARALSDKIELRGDFIIDGIEKDGAYIFKYVIGGVFEYDEDGNAIWREQTGIEYQEKINFTETIESGLFTDISGADDNIQYLQRKLVLDSNWGYNENFRSSTNIRQAMVHFMQSDVMSQSYVYPLISQDQNMGLTDNLSQSVRVSVDRGSSAAFEHHYKICECKTFSDLQNYGNNFFNL